MEGNEKKGGGLPPTQQRHLNIDTTVGGSISQPVSPSMSYSTDRETVMRSASGHATVAETHLIRSIGSQSQSYTEEHWSSEITSFVALAPPKFIQVIKAYRVHSTDTISLVVEVASDPPAIFEWFYNEKSVLQDRDRFQVGHGINISRLKVSRPEQGVYKCVTRNPAGVSTSYGYITVNADREHLSSSKEDMRLQRQHSVTYHQAPRFLTQVPNLFVTAGSNVIIDVEVDANPPARFSWFVNGKEYRDSIHGVEMFSPDVNRSVVRFSIPVAGEYKVVASNVHGSAMSCGHVDIQKVIELEESTLTTSTTAFDPMTTSMRALGNNGRNSRQAVNMFELNYTQRSSSVPRGVRHLESHIEVSNMTGEEKKTQQQTRTGDDDSSFEIVPPNLPEECAPKIVEPLHSASFLDGQAMSLRCKITANPSAAVVWSKDDVNVEDWVLNKDVTTTVLDGGVCELLNPECFAEDAGLYKCTATNPHGTAETAAFINVEGAEYIKDHEEAEISESVLTDDVHIILPPKFIETLTAETDNFQQLGYVRMVATVRSVAPITVSWQKDGMDIYENEKYEVMQFADGAQILTIRAPTNLDSGVYTCTAESEHGVSNSSCQVELTISAESSPESFEKVEITPPEEVKETGIDDDIEVILKEEVSGTAQIEKREEEFKLLVKVADQVASTLVANVFLEAVHEAVKKIVETEDEEEDNQIEATQEPRFETSTDEYHVKENGTIKMAATISGHPTPFLEWYFGEEKLQVSQNVSMYYEAGTSAIILKNVQKRQGGNYFLRAHNCHGESILPMKLTVDPIEAVTHVLETSIPKVVVEQDAKEEEVRRAAEIISEQFAQLWVQDAQTEAVSAQAHQTPVVAEQASEEPTLPEVVAALQEQKPSVEKAPQPQFEVLETEDQDVVEQMQKQLPPVQKSMSVQEEKASSQRTPSPMNYEDKVKTIQSNLLRVNSHEAMEPIEATNLLLNTALQLKNEHVCDETTTVIVTQQPQKYDQLVTVVESNIEYHALRLSTSSSSPLKFIDLETIIQKPSTSCESIDRMFVEKSKRTANAQHRIVVLQGMSNTFHNAITWSLKKVKKLVGDAEAKAYADVEVVKQDETNEQVMTIIDNDTIVPQLLQVAAAANKLKLENVSVALIKEGDRAHQELVIEYESSIDEPMFEPVHNTSHLTFHQQQPTGPDQHVWSRRSKFEEDEAHVVAVFVEVDANCPDQSVEIVATVNAAYEGDNRQGIEDEPFTEVSQSLATESSAAPQAPKFLRKLVNCFGRIGEPVQLKCLIAGMPQPEIEWTVDGDPIVPNDEYSIVYEDGVCILRIESTLIEDEGEYCCTASNVAGTTFSKCYLKLSEADDDAVDLLRQLSEIKIIDPTLSTGYPMSMISDEENTSHQLLSNVLLTDKEVPITATYNEDLSRAESFRRFFESAETTVKVTELYQGESVEAQFQQPEKREQVSTSNTDVMFVNQKVDVMESTVSTVGNAVRQSVSSSTNSWDYMFNDPFPESQEINVIENELYEPRVPLLPQKLSYKGQEIFANTNTVERNSKAGAKAKGEVENLKKCVETLLLFDAEMDMKDIKESSPKKEIISKKDQQSLDDQIKVTQQILKDVERDLNKMERTSPGKSLSPNKRTFAPKDVEDIEAAIFSISDQLADRQSSEEALREALQEMILSNSSPMKELSRNNETSKPEVLKSEIQKIPEVETKISEVYPIVKLKQAISAIENSLLEDTEVTEIMKRKGSDKDKRKATRIKRVPSAHSARITPITSNLRDRLNQLHQLTVSEDSGSLKQNEEAKEIQELFVKIEKEINTIAELCKEKMTKKGADTVTHVLNSVLQHVASIINVILVAQDHQPIEVHAETTKTAEVSVWYSFDVHPESEDIIGIVDEEPTNRRPSSTPRGSTRSSNLTTSQDSQATTKMTVSSEDTIEAPIAPPRKGRSLSRDAERLLEIQPRAPPRRSRQSGDTLSPEPTPVLTLVKSDETPAPVRPPRSRSRHSGDELAETSPEAQPIRPPRSHSRHSGDELEEVQPVRPPRSKSKTADANCLQIESMDESQYSLSCIHIQKTNFAFTNSTHETSNASVVVDLRNMAQLECTVQSLDDLASIQMLCEESDYPSDTDRSLLLAGTVRYFNRASPSLHEVSPSLNMESVSMDLKPETEPEEIVQDVYVNVELHSVPSLSSLVEVNPNTLMQTLASEKSSLKAAEEDEKEGEEEGEEEVTADVSFIGRSVLSTETLDVVLEEKDMSQMNSTLPLDYERAFSSNTIRETDILSDESITVDSSYHKSPEPTVDFARSQVKSEEVTENFSLIHKPARRRVTGIVVNSLIYTIAANIAEDNTFDVDVVQEPQRYNISIKVIEDIVDFTSLTIMSDCEDDPPADVLVLKQDTSKLQALSYDDISVATTRTGITVSIVARSLNDGIYASLEEIAWGEVEMTVPDIMQMSTEEKSSLQFNVTVSESNLEEAKSLKSQVSFRSSQNSVSEMDNTISSTATISIPSYVVKLESTATITCELNNYLPKNCTIDWYCGKTKIIIDHEQFDRISHDLLEVLIIRSVEAINGNLYSLKINEDLFPVAYLIVENTNLTTSANILTRPETQFVMEGQPTVITVELDDPNVIVNWLKDRRPLHENERIRLETDGQGNHRVIIPNTCVGDQGTYLALTSSESVAITLVVEERIEEKEVMVIASGTESEEDDVQEYLVPPGSTATIACELEECELKRSIRWLRDGKDIRFEQGKTEHVQNGLKHYLVVHDATSLDSGLYSVCISNVEFRVAHLCVNSLTSTLHALKRKRISNNSLHN
ncbi:Ig-like domain-containing protein [Caenorhabditis elegans]|uniref:Ig-like domain-containing protein n=1 Tax=Caenorhabditis elegans TaxID=6239 RepID=A0A2I2LDV4_CAEEL|nr:Ig-like domain-containing protein [Caenorhabditis elegans]SOT38352.1 Ig-like domain-containing protein [Caenorhabditis elegans]|eukprot:NP_001346724.1 Titin homolog [Caenorhabditis elegans]